MDKMEILAGLQASLDETNDALGMIAATLSENAAMTRQLMDEILNGVEPNPQTQLSKECGLVDIELDDVLPKKKMVTGGFDIESEDYEEMIDQIKNTPLSLIPENAKVTELSPGIKMLELDVSGMSDEEISKHIENTIKGIMNNNDDEGMQPYE